MSYLIIELFQEGEIEIVHKPKRYPVRISQIHSLYGRHRKEFKQGIFKEKIAYET